MNELKGKKNDSPSLPLKNSELEEKLIKYE